jgi:hypothetical protein
VFPVLPRRRSAQERSSLIFFVEGEVALAFWFRLGV